MFDDIYKKIFGKKGKTEKDPEVIEVLPIKDLEEPKIIKRIPGNKSYKTVNDDPVVNEIIDMDDEHTPKEFSKMCRTYLKDSMLKGKCYRNDDFLENPETGWLNGSDLRYLAKELDITGAFLSINNIHWNLILSADEYEIRTYDPMTTRTKNTIRKFNTSDTDITMMVLSEDLQNEYERQADKMPQYIRKLPNGCTLEGPDFTIKDFLTKMNNGDGYKISDSFIEELGAPQNNTYDCGPLVLYAAKMSNKEPIVLDRY